VKFAKRDLVEWNHDTLGLVVNVRFEMETASKVLSFKYVDDKGRFFGGGEKWCFCCGRIEQASRLWEWSLLLEIEMRVCAKHRFHRRL
jgi:hypothetical protein